MNAQRQCRSFLADKDPPPPSAQHSSNYFLADNAHAIAITLFHSRLFSCQMKNLKNKKETRTNRKILFNNNSFLCFIFTPCQSRTEFFFFLMAPIDSTAAQRSTAQ
jgi:hypothetical protein